jgi:hypothetical protein
VGCDAGRRASRSSAAMRIRKRAPPVATAAAEEELRLQQFSCPAVSGSLSNRGRSDSDGVHHVDGGSCRIVAPTPSVEAPAAGGLCTTDCENVESEATRRPRPTDGTISPVSLKLFKRWSSIAFMTCTCDVVCGRKEPFTSFECNLGRGREGG